MVDRTGLVWLGIFPCKKHIYIHMNTNNHHIYFSKYRWITLFRAIISIALFLLEVQNKNKKEIMEKERFWKFKANLSTKIKIVVSLFHYMLQSKNENCKTIYLIVVPPPPPPTTPAAVKQQEIVCRTLFNHYNIIWVYNHIMDINRNGGYLVNKSPFYSNLFYLKIHIICLRGDRLVSNN